MSWLFGLNKGQQSDIDLSAFKLPPAGGGDDSGSDGKGKDSQGQKTMEAYRFDSAALERAAKAAKDLERSRTHYIMSWVLLKRGTSKVRNAVAECNPSANPNTNPNPFRISFLHYAL